MILTLISVDNNSQQSVTIAGPKKFTVYFYQQYNVGWYKYVKRLFKKQKFVYASIYFSINLIINLNDNFNNESDWYLMIQNEVLNA